MRIFASVCDGEGRPIIMLLSEGQMSDHKGARLILDALPPAACLIADRGDDSVRFREALTAKGIAPGADIDGLPASARR